LRREIEEWASRERRSLGNFTQLMVDWAFEQLKIVGSMKRLLKSAKESKNLPNIDRPTKNTATPFCPPEALVDVNVFHPVTPVRQFPVVRKQRDWDNGLAVPAEIFYV
jgi:hypothetical protein